MRGTIRKLAASVKSSQSLIDLREASASLHLPIPLYRRLLRAQRGLPYEMRSLGDAYVKAEFRRHREVTNPVHVMGFLTQWKIYLDQLPSTGVGARNFSGKKLDVTIFEKMSNEQLGQLYELLHTTKELWKPVENKSKS